MTNLIGDDGKAIPCHEPRPGFFVSASVYTAEQAAAMYPPDYSDLRPMTAADVESHRLTGYRCGDPRGGLPLADAPRSVPVAAAPPPPAFRGEQDLPPAVNAALREFRVKLASLVAHCRDAGIPVRGDAVMQVGGKEWTVGLLGGPGSESLMPPAWSKPSGAAS